MVGRYRVRIVFMGTPEFAVPSLEHLIFNKYQVVAVYTKPDSASGRGRSLIYSPIKRAALDFRLPVIQPENFRKVEVVAQLASFKPDIIIVAAFGQILPQSVLDIPVYKCINIHPSLLPKFRGTSPVAAAILAGEEFTGVSIMLTDIGLDTGPVLVQAQIPVTPLDTTGSLTAKLSLIAAHLLLETLPRWSRGQLVPRVQDETKTSYVGMFSKQEGKIDWQLPAIDIWRRVRAFQPWPGCYTRWQGKQLKIIQAMPLSAEKGHEIGEVVALDKAGAAFGVSTGDGVLGILKVQLEGKRAMSAGEFLRGQRQLIGAILS
jgi:methionyl-tRNA formyltransferase